MDHFHLSELTISFPSYTSGLEVFCSKKKDKGKSITKMLVYQNDIVRGMSNPLFTWGSEPSNVPYHYHHFTAIESDLSICPPHLVMDHDFTSTTTCAAVKHNRTDLCYWSLYLIRFSLAFHHTFIYNDLSLFFWHVKFFRTLI